MERKELVRAIDHFLMSLPETEQNVFLCRYWYLDSVQVISEVSGFSQSKVTSMLHRTREKLRKELSKEGYLFGQVRDSYVVQAGQFREGKQAPQTKRLSLRRPLLVGCAVVYMLSLQDLKPGEEIREDSRTGTTEVRQVLSLQGVVGTPGYLASKEWYEWEQAYDPDMEIYHSD